MQSFTDPSHDVADPLTSDQLALLRAALDGLLAEHRERLEQSEDLFRTLSADSSVDGMERQAARRAAEEATLGIERAAEALASIDAGTYGACRSCGRAIPFERLEALPATRTCVACPGD